jgi:hypothetical protein
LILSALTLTVIADWRTSADAELGVADRIEFQTFEIDGEIENMMWCGKNDEAVLV